jgi:hypothetical protein
MLAVDKHSSILQTLINYSPKNFYKIGFRVTLSDQIGSLGKMLNFLSLLMVDHDFNSPCTPHIHLCLESLPP